LLVYADVSEKHAVSILVAEVIRRGRRGLIYLKSKAFYNNTMIITV
jgi:hypothetical protein